MNHEKFNIVMNIFAQANVAPLLGVVPDNQNMAIGGYERDLNFWEHMRELQEQDRAEFAIHGLNHQYITKEGGLLATYGYKKQSEFAGIPYEEQYAALKRAVEIFKRYGLETDVFMAPGHTFDEHTICALKNLGVTSITDGVGLFPYQFKGVTLVPQQVAVPRTLPCGVITICLHTNSITEKAIRQIEEFVSRNQNDIIAFSEVKNLKNRWYYAPANFLFKICYYCICQIKRRNNR